MEYYSISHYPIDHSILVVWFVMDGLFNELQGISKGTAVENIISTMISQGKEPDFVLCIGDDYSDEVMFETIAAKVPNQLPAAAKVFPCSVGMKPSKAKYFLDDTDEVIKLLQGLTNPGRLGDLKKLLT